MLKSLIKNDGRNQLWLRETTGAVVFFVLSLIILSFIRVFFFYWYRSTEPFTGNFIDALVMGTRLDARWLGQGLVVSWLLWVVSIVIPKARAIAKFLVVLVLGLFVLSDLVNFGFYGFYGTPISSIIFGLAQDDTWAVIITIWRDWPVITYCVALVILTAIPCVCYRLFQKFIAEKLFRNINAKQQWGLIAVLTVVFTVVLGVVCRGSFGTFPLRQQDLIVGTNEFINATIPNGFSALYEANKSRKALDLRGGAGKALANFGFASESEPLNILQGTRGAIAQSSEPTQKRHVVLTVMESMGIDQFDSDSLTNNMLGSLRDELKGAFVFRNALSVHNGTFPSLEGLLFDTPLTPLTQSAYGKKQFSFSQALAFKSAGYKTVYLTSGTEKWREVDTNFPIQGFDRILGAAAIKEKYPQAEFGTWGVGDRWTFQFAADLLEQADKNNEKLFLVILSATNHPPHKVPDGVAVEPVDTNALLDYVVDDRNSELLKSMMQTYQYSADALGKFIHALREKQLMDKSLIAVTGDHNARLKYESTGYWHRQFGVPVIFWLPQDIHQEQVEINTNRWAGHRDIFPTLRALAFGDAPKPWQGRNLFGNEQFDMVLSYQGIGKDGFAVGNYGSVAIDGANYRCFAWDLSGKYRSLVPVACTNELDKMGKAAVAQRALADFMLRKEVLK